MQDTYIGDEGKGFPLVLVHGFLGSSKMWKPQINFLKDNFWIKFCIFCCCDKPIIDIKQRLPREMSRDKKLIF